jgi:hypothetical protein
MNKTRAVNVYKSDYDVYVGRNPKFGNAKWGNPYDDPNMPLHEKIIRYEDYIRNTPELWDSLHELRGKRLGCHCKPRPCHADVLVKLVNEVFNEQTEENEFFGT